MIREPRGQANACVAPTAIRLAFACCIWAACGVDASRTEQRPPPREYDDQRGLGPPDAPMLLSAPPGASVSHEPGAVVIRDDAGEASMSLVRRRLYAVARAQDVMTGEWRRHYPVLDCAPTREVARVAADGWDEELIIHHAARPGFCRFAQTQMRRLGSTWYLLLIEAPVGARERALVLAEQVWDSLHVPGILREDLAAKPFRPIDAGAAADLAEFVDASIRTAGVPGAAFVIVSTEGVLLQGASGTTRVGGGTAAQPDTLFRIGSITKPLTSLLAASLVDEGLLTWDTRLDEIYPEYSTLPPPLARLPLYATMCACMGLRRADAIVLLEFEGMTPETYLAEGLSRTRVKLGQFAYNNQIFAVGGYACAASSEPGLSLNQSFARALEARVLVPLGMRSVSLTAPDTTDPRWAWPHAVTRDLHYSSVSDYLDHGLNNIAPAGGAWASVRDLARLLQMELRLGELDGKRIFSRENLLYRRIPRTHHSAHNEYALGWFVKSDNGITIVHHVGDTVGYTGEIFLLPDYGVGAAILMNGGDGGPVRSAFRRKLLELWFAADDRSARLLEAGVA